MRVLLVEDNEKLVELISDGLGKAGFAVDAAFNADEAMEVIKVGNYNLVILDLGLPDEDGLYVLKEFRKGGESLPVLILTARDALEEKIKGFNLGADDYLTKPFAMQELVARVHALARRPSNNLNLRFSLENLVYDPQARQAEVDGNAIKLSRRETSLLDMLIRTQGRTLPKENIELQLYSYGEEGSANSVEVLVHRLRKKLQSGNAAIEIHTLRGIGYMMTGNRQ